MSSGTDIIKWGDDAMFEAAPMQKDARGQVTPRVTLLSATPDPLGCIAAGFRMYAGKPTYNLADITDDERRWAWEESLKTYLKAPWEFVDFHFFIEGVTRALTHQLVRQRTAVYAQESLRFAVKEDSAAESAIPPSIVSLAKDDPKRVLWDQGIKYADKTYKALVNAGIPAEDARGILPHATTTRTNYKTNLRNLVDTLGNRLCTQAQFEWRAVALGIIKAIRDYNPPTDLRRTEYVETVLGNTNVHHKKTNWQFQLLATPIAQTFTPVCYKAGKCVFMGDLDRKCSIRKRVNEMGAAGIPSDHWHEDIEQEDGQMLIGVDPIEWMADANAGRRGDAPQDVPSA